MKFRAHIALRRDLPGRALCGKPVKGEARRALFVCTKCANALIREYVHRPRYVITWNYSPDEGVRP